MYILNPFQQGVAADRKSDTFQTPNVTLWHVGTATYHASGVVPHPLQNMGQIPHFVPATPDVRYGVDPLYAPSGRGTIENGGFFGRYRNIIYRTRT